MTAEETRKGKAALGAAALAFRRAQDKGNVWISDQGVFETFEYTGAWQPAPPKNPDQLRLA